MRYRQKGGSTSEALEEGGSIYLSRGWVKALSVEAMPALIVILHKNSALAIGKLKKAGNRSMTTLSKNIIFMQHL
jgi:hypothetical protein